MAVVLAQVVASGERREQFCESVGVKPSTLCCVAQHVGNQAQVGPVLDQVGDGSFDRGHRESVGERDVGGFERAPAIADLAPLGLATNRRAELVPISRQVADTVQRRCRRTHDDHAARKVSEALFGGVRRVSGQPSSPQALELLGGSAGVAIDPVCQALEVTGLTESGEVEPWNPVRDRLCRRHHPPLGCRQLLE